jgi:hypothetical protein
MLYQVVLVIYELLRLVDLKLEDALLNIFRDIKETTLLRYGRGNFILFPNSQAFH